MINVWQYRHIEPVVNITQCIQVSTHHMVSCKYVQLLHDQFKNKSNERITVKQEKYTFVT
jgi:hypothetical protein